MAGCQFGPVGVELGDVDAGVHHVAWGTGGRTVRVWMCGLRLCANVHVHVRVRVLQGRGIVCLSLCGCVK